MIGLDWQRPCGFHSMMHRTKEKRNKKKKSNIVENRKEAVKSHERLKENILKEQKKIFMKEKTKFSNKIPRQGFIIIIIRLSISTLQRRWMINLKRRTSSAEKKKKNDTDTATIQDNSVDFCHLCPVRCHTGSSASFEPQVQHSHLFARSIIIAVNYGYPSHARVLKRKRHREGRGRKKLVLVTLSFHQTFANQNREWGNSLSQNQPQTCDNKK